MAFDKGRVKAIEDHILDCKKVNKEYGLPLLLDGNNDQFVVFVEYNCNKCGTMVSAKLKHGPLTRQGSICPICDNERPITTIQVNNN